MKSRFVLTKHKVVAGMALTIAGALALGPQLGSAQSGPPWGTFHGSATRAGVSNVNGPIGPQASNIWSLARPVQSSPVVDANGTAYAGDDDGYVYGFSTSQPTITKRFSFQTGGPVVGTPTLSPDGKTLYFTSQDGSVYAANTSDGSKKWATPLGGTLSSSPLLNNDGSLLYVPLPYGGFKTLKASDGSVVQTTPINGSIAGSLALSPDGSTVYVATTNGYMYGVSAPTASNKGQLSPFYMDGEALGTPAVDSSGNIYVTTSQGTLDKFNPTSSAPAWIAKTSKLAASSSTPAIFNGVVYFGSGDGNLHAVKASDGTEVWSVHTGANIASSAAIAAGNSMVYVGSEDGLLYAFNASTGALVWQRSLGVAVDVSPALGPEGALWIASVSGQVLRIYPQTIPGTPGSNPGATSTPTATLQPAPSPTSGSTGPGAPVVTLKAKVKPGKKQVIKVTTSAGAVIRFRVDYPNGDHQSHRATANSSGAVTYSFKQGASKIRHNRFYATVTVKNASNATTTKQYKILFGSIDASAEPRVQSTNHKVNLWVHTSARTRVVTFLLFPNGKLTKFNGKTGPKGWAHLTYKVGKKLTRGKNHKVTVLARLYNRPKVSTKTNFTIK